MCACRAPAGAIRGGPAAALSLFAWLALAAPTLADADGPDFFRVTGVAAGDVLNIRAAPDAGAAKIGEIAPGADGLRNLGCEGGLGFADWERATEAERAAARASRWCRVAYRGGEGWVAGRFLAEGSAPGAVTAAAAGAAHSFVPAPGAATDYWSVSGVKGHLNVRAAAGTGAPALAQVLPGAVLRNLGCTEGDGPRWCDVQLLDGTRIRGWAAAEYLEPASSALRAGHDIFDAIGHIPCAQTRDQPMMPCEFGVARDGGGSATVVVIRPDATRRALFFERGAFLSADTSQADGYPEYGATRDGDLTFVRVGDERYEIPEALIHGG